MLYLQSSPSLSSSSSLVVKDLANQSLRRAKEEMETKTGGGRRASHKVIVGRWINIYELEKVGVCSYISSSVYLREIYPSHDFDE